MNIAISIIKRFYLVVIVIIVNVSQLFVNSIWYSKTDRIVFLNVGQGDATLVQHGITNILIDGGNDLSLLERLNLYLDLGEEIDYVILTHPHADHLVGILYLLERLKVKSIILSNTCFVNDLTKYLWKIGNTKLVVTREYETLITANSLKLEILDLKENNPELKELTTCEDLNSSEGWYSSKNLNNASLVVKVETPNKKILIMGDAEIKEESALLKNFNIGKHHILKAGHHCSSSSTSEELLQNVIPKYVICSYGINKYGHPSKAVINRMEEIGATVLHTQNGDIIFQL